MATSHRLTIVIPTHERVETVRRSLRRIGELPWHAANDIRVVVVQNGRKLPVDGHQLLTGFDYHELHEPQLGKTRAINRGLQEVSSELVLLMDDDVLLGDEFPSALAAVENGWADVAVFGGPMRPAWPRGKPPFWYSKRLAVVCGDFDLGHEPRYFEQGKSPVGALRLFRRWVFDKYGQFSEEDGLAGRERRGVPGTRLLSSIAHNERRLYLPNLAAEHVVLEHQATVRYYIAHGYRWGRGEVRRVKEFRRHVFGVPLYVAKRFVMSGFELMLSCFSLRPTVVMDGAYRFSLRLGNVSHFLVERPLLRNHRGRGCEDIRVE